MRNVSWYSVQWCSDNITVNVNHKYVVGLIPPGVKRRCHLCKVTICDCVHVLHLVLAVTLSELNFSLISWSPCNFCNTLQLDCRVMQIFTQMAHLFAIPKYPQGISFVFAVKTYASDHSNWRMKKIFKTEMVSNFAVFILFSWCVTCATFKVNTWKMVASCSLVNRSTRYGWMDASWFHFCWLTVLLDAFYSSKQSATCSLPLPEVVILQGIFCHFRWRLLFLREAVVDWNACNSFEFPRVVHTFVGGQTVKL